ncbi:efflux RND transporter permease subunit [Aestuariivivens sediminicola]|uniref:efflux RND transporter permease subunit n=1 Tax=Aestuariivivens sediminicola TaxID=2913560 RepID=UPI001F55E645|nr:MMPL family transporter [Aestuariivivens sediminicola]
MIKILIKYRILFFLLLLSLTALAGLKISSIRINTDFSQFLPDNDPEYSFYKKLRTQLKNDESILIIGIDNAPTIYDKHFINKVQVFKDSLESIKGILQIGSITDLTYPVKSMFGLLSFPYLEPNDSLELENQKGKIIRDSLITRNFVNKTGTALFIWVELNEPLSETQFQNTLMAIEKTRDNFPELKSYLWGKRYLQESLNEITKNETKKTVVWALLFLLIALALILRTPVSIFLSIVLVVISLVLFIGGMASLNRPFNIMANLFPTIILVVGISDFIHLLMKYNSESNTAQDNDKAIYNTIREIGRAIFITSFTTAIGFFILQISPMKILRNFGLEAGIAVILTFIVTLIVTPIFFSTSKLKGQFSLNPIFSGFSNKLLKHIENLQNFPKTIMVVYTTCTVIAFISIFSINTNNLQYSIPDNSELKTNYGFFEHQLGGSRTFEMVIEAGNGHTLNEPDVLNQINRIQHYLDSLPYLTAVKSPLLFYRTMHKAYKPLYRDSSELKVDTNDIAKYEKHFTMLSNSSFLMNEEKTLFKFSAQMKDFGRHDVQLINDTIIADTQNLLDTTKATARISGMDYLFDRAHEKRIQHMLLGLILAILIVAVTLGIIFKKPSITLLALLMNVIPIVISAGIMGFTNLELRAGSSIIFTIAFVIAVDDTIHLLSKFLWERKQGNSVDKALGLAIKQCGKAILATSIILIGGFSVLMLSAYNEMFTLGFLMSVVILITLSVDLVLAPICIIKFKKYF